MTTPNTHGKWSQTNYTWDNNPFKWSDIEFIDGLITDAIAEVGSGGAVYEALRQQAENFETPKYRKFIKLICIVKGEEYSDKKLVNGDVKVTAKDIQVLVEAIEQVKVSIKIK